MAGWPLPLCCSQNGRLTRLLPHAHCSFLISSTALTITTRCNSTAPTPLPAGGLTLQQILQQYSSSGYKSRGASSRRNSMEVPAGGRRSMDAGSVGGSMARESILSQSAMSDLEDISWLGDN